VTGMMISNGFAGTGWLHRSIGVHPKIPAEQVCQPSTPKPDPFQRVTFR
jgi:hypothetical protein